MANYSTNVVRTRTYVWSANGSSTATLLSTREVSVEGLNVWESFAGVTNTSVTSLPSGGARTITQTAPDGSYSISLYQNGRLSSVTRYASNGVQVAKTTYGYDPNERQSTVTDARNGTTTYTFNDADQVASLTTPAPGNGQSPQTTFTYYNAMHQATNTVLADGGSVTTFYSPRGELLKTSGARTYPVAYSYDAQGRLKTMTNWTTYATGAGARVTTWNYDAYRGFLAGKLYADTNGPSYTYTAAGRLQTRIWARGVGTTNVYNELGDLRLVDYSDSTPDVSYVYDRRGRPTTVTADANTTTLIYNDAGQVLSEAGTAGLLNGFAVTNTYDLALRRSSLAVRSNTTALFTHSYAYDSASRLTNVTDGTYSAGYSYLANSPLVSQISFRHSGTLRMTTTKQYDFLNRLQSIISSASNTISSAYQYNDANQRASRVEADGSLWVYGYDALGQVASGKKYWSDWTPIAGQQFEYTFDDIGNRSQTKAGGNEVGSSLRTANYTANTLNQYSSREVPGTNDIIGMAKATAAVTVNGQSAYRKGEYYQKALSFDNTSAAVYPLLTNQAVLTGETNIITGNIFLPKTQENFAYDTDGNLTNDGRWTFTWDAENRLISMESRTNAPDSSKRKLEFRYDWRSRRVQKTVSAGSNYVAQSTNKFLYDDWNLTTILDTPSSALVSSFLWGLDLSGSIQGAGGVGGLLAINSPTGGVHFVSIDGNGNVSGLITATNGTLSANYEYGPFGEVIRANRSTESLNPFRYSTKFQDEDSDLLYYGYRYYTTVTGRWLNRDPIGEQGGVNLDASFYNNPLSYVDRNGLDNWGNPGGGQNAPPVIIYPPTPTPERTPIRPDNRDRPQRRPESRTGRRVERRAGPEPFRGDANCTRCGPDVSAGIVATMTAVKARFDALPDDQKSEKCGLFYMSGLGAGTWDINFPDPPAGCGEGPCWQTVMVDGKCYDFWKVNYILFGRMSSLCDFWRIKMEGVMAAQKLIRKPLIDGDWENEYTGDVRGFARIGYNWDGSLPSSLSGPTGGFGGCKPCDKPGAKDPKYNSAFSTTWP